MTNDGFRALPRRSGWFYVMGLLMSAVFVVTGCGSMHKVKKTTRKIANDITFTKQDITKTVGLSLFQDKTGAAPKQTNRTIDTNMEMLFRKHLSQSLKADCSDLFLITPDDSKSPEILKRPPRSVTGRIDNVALAGTGEQVGLNAVITGSLLGISAYQKESGLFWMKKSHHLVSLLVDIEVYDTQTAAKILDDSVTHRFEVDESVFKAIRSKKIKDLSAFEGEIKKAGIASSKKICKTLNKLPWKGRVVSVSGSEIVISSGQHAGIKRGDVFEVYSVEKQVGGAGRYRYFQPGVKYAEIKIIAVSGDRAKAISASGGPVTAGSSIRLKR